MSSGGGGGYNEFFFISSSLFNCNHRISRHCLLPIHLHHLNEIKMEEKNNLSKCANHRHRRKKSIFDTSKRGHVDCFSYRKFNIKNPNAASTVRLFPKVRATKAAKVYCIKILLSFITTLLNMQYGSKTTRYLLPELSNHSSIWRVLKWRALYTATV